jgi:hypothetical protein
MLECLQTAFCCRVVACEKRTASTTSMWLYATLDLDQTMLVDRMEHLIRGSFFFWLDGGGRGESRSVVADYRKQINIRPSRVSHAVLFVASRGVFDLEGYMYSR